MAPLPTFVACLLRLPHLLPLFFLTTPSLSPCNMEEFAPTYTSRGAPRPLPSCPPQLRRVGSGPDPHPMPTHPTCPAHLPATLCAAFAAHCLGLACRLTLLPLNVQHGLPHLPLVAPRVSVHTTLLHCPRLPAFNLSHWREDHTLDACPCHTLITYTHAPPHIVHDYLPLQWTFPHHT